ncbi:uncharacterized protein DUF4326 [Roseiarcus fermentans]|uniref:Uncharacterized protein DUF4326 n=1 Tax=Roseiarcus fermentans TaxID=1473586 RepID=A0A366EFG5_9HYPH|nr:DUF4326 domain-containing protein [Roseiarcus fermentans]RBP01073.1 uncharacterized protein DUF4326 [Roseiarcus fermentans]
MTAPVRLQLSRKRGFDLQRWSREVNGLAAVVVARPSKWGNPYKVAPAFESAGRHIPAITAEDAVSAYREIWDRRLECHRASGREMLAELAGKNLACWCAPGAPCHADVLIELANAQ